MNAHGNLWSSGEQPSGLRRCVPLGVRISVRTVPGWFSPEERVFPVLRGCASTRAVFSRLREGSARVGPPRNARVHGPGALNPFSAGGRGARLPRPRFLREDRSPGHGADDGAPLPVLPKGRGVGKKQGRRYRGSAREAREGSEAHSPSFLRYGDWSRTAVASRANDWYVNSNVRVEEFSMCREFPAQSLYLTNDALAIGYRRTLR